MQTSLSQTQRWYVKAQIDYNNLYIALYASFNSWYTQRFGGKSDREVLNLLRSGIPLWKHYCEGLTLQTLRSPMTLLVEFSQREPLPTPTRHWGGEVENIFDWASLVEYWYRVRCLVVHGAAINPLYVHLAYETLNCVMGEILRAEQA